MPPTYELSTTPPNTRMPGKTRCIRYARDTVLSWWHFSKMAFRPASRAARTMSKSSARRGNRSG